ncbi:GMC family oxidoreductase N-terminal domain-containing protein [Orrella sp. JC864]|uniref:GMC family oxidoreductase n=1 Tax=Orrella sp. JC864 TaxID=3120298 RepID=UPI00142ABAFD
MDTYDYVIVGGGTAGCILANRLSADGRSTVALLEAGEPGRGLWVGIPAGFTKLLTHPRWNWGFRSEPEPGTCDRPIAIPRGKGLGGSTLINGMIYVRGQPGDYDAWAQAGARGWSHADVAPYFEKLEQTTVGGAGRGRSGPMHITEVAERFPISEAFLQAAGQDGWPRNPDYNGASQEGVGYYQVCQHRGRRWSVADGYLRPALRRRNLDVRTQVHVTSLVLEQGRCTGVRLRRADGSTSQLRARHSVVLTAGAVQSPQLLELSGIGSPQVLAAAGIPVAHALAGVGENYIDHYATRMNWRVRGARTLNESTRGLSLAAAVARYAVQRRGILTLGTGLAFGFVKTDPAMPTPDVQYFFMHASYADAAVRKLDRLPGMTLGVAQLRPRSRGSIHVASADPHAAPAIRPNLLTHPQDQRCLIDGMRIARRIVEQPAMARYVQAELNPGPQVQTDAQWLEFARRTGQTIYHPIGTCRMGEDEHAVVDSRLRVRGLQGLRVADASVMPAMVSGNTQAAVMMIAEKAADLLLQDARSA